MFELLLTLDHDVMVGTCFLSGSPPTTSTVLKKTIVRQENVKQLELYS
jgi:hypothetical protein